MPIRLTAQEVIKVLQRHGFDCVSQKGSHQKYKNKTTGAVTIVPYHSGKHLPIGTLFSIIRASGIDKTEFGF
jgi:predicted RNA binding protein YcfA (HicA-like mRNA interferase family)